MRLSPTIMSSSASLPLRHRYSFSTTPLSHSNYTNSSSSLPNNIITLISPQLDQQCSSLKSSKPHFPNNFSQKPKTIRYRFSQLCRDGQIKTARQLFDSIPQPTTVLWNTIIIGYICNNLPHEAIVLYSKMKSSREHQPDPYTYSSVLKACAEVKEFRIGKAVHCHILRSGIFPGRIVYNSLLNMYATCLSSYDALSSCDLVNRMFSSMPKRNVVAWNTMISWYLKTERHVEGLVHFVRMLKMGIKPTNVSFVNVFPVACRMMDVQIADVLYGIAIKLGDEFVDDLFVVSSAINVYAELGCLVDARKIFDNCLQRNIEIWNSMICAYVQNNCAIEALNLFLRALEAQGDVVINVVTFLLALTATSQLQNLGFTQQLHALLIKKSLSEIILLNATVSTYAKCNYINESFQVFNGMQERDIVSWNTMISALVQNGMDFEGLMLVYEMQAQGFVIDDVTIAAILSAASNLRNQDYGKQTHAYLMRHRIQFEGMNTYLIDMYAKSGMVKAAQAVFDMNCSKDRDQAMWNAIISGNTQNGLIKQAFAILRQMLEQDVIPTAVTLASILPACSQSGSLALGKAIHGYAIRNFFDENVFVSSALVDMYSKSGAIHYAESIFRMSSEKNSVTYTNMILGFGQHGMGEKAIMAFNSWKDCGFQPDGVIFLAALSACSYSGLITEGLQIFESMKRDYEVQPSMEHYACVVDMLGRVGRVVEAFTLVREIDEQCNVLGIWGSLLATCRIHKNFELGKVVANKLLALAGGDKTTGYHVLLSNIYAAEGNWEYVNRVRRGMKETGLTKKVGCSWINLSGVAHCFASKDETHPLHCEIYETLQNLSSNMKDAGYRPSLGLQELCI